MNRRATDAPRDLSTAKGVGIGVLIAAAVFVGMLCLALWLSK